MNMPQTLYRRQKGVGLIEILVAMTLGLIISAGVIQAYIGNARTSRMTEAASRIQENARFALDIMAREIRMAGYRGCLSKVPVSLTNTLKNPAHYSNAFETGIQGFENVGAALPAALANHFGAGIKPNPGSDVLIIRGPTGNSVRVSQNNNGAQVFATFTGKESGACSGGTDKLSGLCRNDIVMITDCQKARVFQITNLTAIGGNTEINIAHAGSGIPGNSVTSWGGASAPPEEVFDNDADIIRVQTVTYFVANEPASGIPTLYRKVNHQAAAPIVDGVRDLQFFYGEDVGENFEVTNYRNAAAVLDWEKVRSVRADLLFMSMDDNIVDAAQTLVFAGADFEAADRRLYEAVGLTTVLRNRVP